MAWWMPFRASLGVIVVTTSGVPEARAELLSPLWYPRDDIEPGLRLHLAATAAVYHGSAAVATWVQCQNSHAVLPSAEITTSARSWKSSIVGRPGQRTSAGIGI